MRRAIVGACIARIWGSGSAWRCSRSRLSVVHSGVVASRCQADYSCDGPVRVRSVAGSSYVASGCGEPATYTCATDNAGGFGTSVCVREASARAPRGQSLLNRARARTLEQNTQATVER